MTRRTARIYCDKAGEWRWRVQAANNEIISAGEGYGDRTGAVKGLRTAHLEFKEADFRETDEAIVEVDPG
jgi:uncharacterized protein YegP (UPF0339 family)